MKRLFIAALCVAAVASCAKSEDPTHGSQTHFLQSCDDSCPAPYDCLCGVCTLACDEDRTCAAEASGAQCTEPSGACSEATVCDVECMRDADCASISDQHTCEEGRCRADTGGGDSGTGGTGGVSGMGSGGTGGMGGMGGASGTGGMGGMSGAGGTGGGPPPALGELCDGSTDLRLGYSADGGFVDVTFYFTNPHGHWFLFIDGQCNYYVSMGYLEGIATGMLDAQQAEEIATNIGWDSIDELTVEDVETCPDAGANSIWAPDGRRVSCTCGCDEGPVSMRKMDALSYMTDLMSDLSMQGQSVTGPVSALAAEAEPIGGELTWPLDMPIASIPSLVHNLNDLGPDPTYALFADADDAAALRALRAQQQPGTPLAIADGEGTYQLWVRDELPEGVSEAIESFTNTNP
jgi:hypothetical protein